jgi:hypothetical protein
LISNAIEAQTANLRTAVDDLRDDVLAALSIGLPDQASDTPASADDPLAPLEGSFARATEIAGKVGTAIGSMGGATADSLQPTVTAAGTGLQNFVTATLSGRDPGSAAIVAWRGVERKAGVGRRGVHDAVEEVQDAL